jgi:shikimate kinase
MTPVFLIGYMGTGKTTLGRAIARKTGMEFIDLDWYIENRFHKSISKIFEERGEDGFRQLERNMLQEVGEFEDTIISCGGGTPCFFDNMDYMNSHGRTVYLKAADDVLFRRLRISHTPRPIIAGKTDDELRDFIHQSVAAREAFYTKAQYVFSSDHLESRQQVSDSVQGLTDLLGIAPDNAAPDNAPRS